MRRIDKEAPELDITAFLNLMVVLVPFLLVTAVFSRITVLQLNLPEAAGASSAADLGEQINIEVFVRQDRLQLGDGKNIIAQFVNLPEEELGQKRYDWKSLNILLSTIKQNLPDKTDLTILLENEVNYDFMIQGMDAVRVVVQEDEAGNKEIYSLFPDIAFGDAPPES